MYVTDVIAAGDAVTGIPFEESDEAVNVYPIASLDESDAPDIAAAFVAFVTSAESRAVLEAAGFGKP